MGRITASIYQIKRVEAVEGRTKNRSKQKSKKSFIKCIQITKKLGKIGT
jgi:hypothetical protein